MKMLIYVFYQHQELCRKLHKEIDLVDEERYDMEIKVTKSNKEVRRNISLSAKGFRWQMFYLHMKSPHML